MEAISYHNDIDDEMEQFLTREAIEDALKEKGDQKDEKQKKSVPKRQVSYKFSKEYPKVDSELDLHGRTQEESERFLYNFINSAKIGKLKTIRVITGRGMHSKNGPVIQNFVERLLEIHQRNGKIKKFKIETNGGSFLIHI